MEKKPSRGVKLLAYLLIFYDLWGILVTICKYHDFLPVEIFYLLFCISGILFGINLLRLKEWARKGIIYYFVVFWFADGVLNFYIDYLNHRITHQALKTFDIIPYLALDLVIFLFYIYFLTRSKVKEQFS